MVNCEYCTAPIDSDVDLDCFTNEGIACKACRIWDTGHVEEYPVPEDEGGFDAPGLCECNAVHGEGTEEADSGVCSCCGGTIP